MFINIYQKRIKYCICLYVLKKSFKSENVVKRGISFLPVIIDTAVACIKYHIINHSNIFFLLYNKQLLTFSSYQPIICFH